MKIVALISLGCKDGSLAAPGEELDLPKEAADRLIEAGKAELPDKPKRANKEEAPE